MSLIEEAQAVRVERAEEYSEDGYDLNVVASLWSAILGVDLGPQQVARMMILLKVARDHVRPRKDNLIDIIGYADVLHCKRKHLKEKNG